MGGLLSTSGQPQGPNSKISQDINSKNKKKLLRNKKHFENSKKLKSPTTG